MDTKIKEKLETIQKMYQKEVIVNRLKKIRFHSLRKFTENTEINFEFPLTVLVGKNGSGKTTVMKAIKFLEKNQKPQYEFFEIEMDDGGVKDTFIEYTVDDNIFSYQRLKKNEWGVEGKHVDSLSIIYIQSKSMVGAIEKSLLYDDVGKSVKREQKVEYVIKQSKKLRQNILDKSTKKQSYFLSRDALKAINFILQKNIKKIEIIRHKYYNGTWAKSVFFYDNNNVYSEYNAGSGEFLIACVIDKLMKVPEKCIVLLDEPEISLHPGAQKRFIQSIMDLIKIKKIQVIIATHSTHIVEGLPKEAIKCFRKIEDEIVLVEENTMYKNAFIELEIDLKDKKHIIVEDSMARDILNEIIKKEKLENLLEVEFYPGGADNIKKHIIFVYSKTNVANRYVIFDGDQYKKNVVNFSEILEKDKTLDFYKKEFKSVTGIKPSSMVWGIDANNLEKRYNVEQEKELINKYLEFYCKNIFFLPELIPEDIIYDEERLKILLGEDEFPTFEGNPNGKAKIKAISEKTGQTIKIIESYLVYWFIKKKNENYSKILEILKHIIES